MRTLLGIILPLIILFGVICIIDGIKMAVTVYGTFLGAISLITLCLFLAAYYIKIIVK